MISEAILEHKAFTRGEERYRKKQERIEKNFGLGETDGAIRLIKSNLKALSDNIKLKLGDQHFADHLNTIGAHKAALITLTYTFKHMRQVSLIVSLCRSIGKHVEAECWAHGLLQWDEKKAKLIEKGVKRKHGSMKYRRQSARSMAARGGYNVENWSDPLKVKVGEFLLNCLLDTCSDIFQLVTVEHTYRRNGKEFTENVKAVSLTPWAVEHMEEVAREVASAETMALPMIEVPDDWQGIIGGGYKDRVLKRLHPLVRVKEGNKEHKALLQHALKSGAMQPVLDAVNAIQRVPFTINRRVLGLIHWARDTKQVIDGLPPPTDYEDPEYPANWEELTDEDRKRWRKKGAEVATKNIGLIGQRVLLSTDLETADTLSLADRFYVPIQLDFRGRVYGMCHFNFQRSDTVRSLFLFAEGKPIGDDGLYWLAIHLANCGDFGKVSKRPFHERVQWVNDNLDHILDVATDPHGTVSYWKEADSPFCFVAACMEYAQALIEGPRYVSTLPVSWDGSCSGLQHLTAMMKSDEGSLVNLTPSQEPQDVYQTVADAVNLKLKADAKAGNALAQAWLGYGVGRKEVKRGVMTYAYSSRAFGMSEQINEDLMVPLADEVLRRKRKEHPFGEGEGYREAFYMGKLLCETIEETIHAPAEAMGFLRKLALALSHEGKSVVWHTPVGMPVMSWYPETTSNRVQLFLHDRGFNVPMQVRMEETVAGKVKKEKSANGIAPNFVHSLDAAHLQMVVNAAVCENITQFALVHDSFGCLAADATRWNEIIREQFVRLYSEFDVLADVRNQTLKNITVANAHRVPDVPTYGSLDVSAVKDSLYAFA